MKMVAELSFCDVVSTVCLAWCLSYIPLPRAFPTLGCTLTTPAKKCCFNHTKRTFDYVVAPLVNDWHQCSDYVD